MPVLFNATGKSRADFIREIRTEFENGVRDVYDSDRWKNWLDFNSRFHHYSARNRFLIYMQNPNATYVASMSKWNELGRYVIKGQGVLGLKVWAPTTFKRTIEKPELDKMGNHVHDEHGKPVYETVTIQEPGFIPVSVYDVSQTEGEPLPTLVDQLTGENRNKDTILRALEKTSRVRISFDDIKGGAEGYFQEVVANSNALENEIIELKPHELDEILKSYEEGDATRPYALYLTQAGERWIAVDDSAHHCLVENFPDKQIAKEWLVGKFEMSEYEEWLKERENRTMEPTIIKSIVIKKGMSDEETITTAVHETCHAILHNKGRKDAWNKTNNLKEVEAESVAYIVCRYLGIDTSKYTFGYLASWSKGKDLPELTQSMDVIIKTADFICRDIMLYARGLNLSKCVNQEAVKAYMENSSYLAAVSGQEIFPVYSAQLAEADRLAAEGIFVEVYKSERPEFPVGKLLSLDQVDSFCITVNERANEEKKGKGLPRSFDKVYFTVHYKSRNGDYRSMTQRMNFATVRSKTLTETLREAKGYDNSIPAIRAEKTQGKRYTR